MAPMMEMAQFVHDPVEERKVYESTSNKQPKHVYQVNEKFYKCQWILCDRVFVGLEGFLNHALDVHGFDEKDGEDSDEVEILKEEDEQSIEQLNPIEAIHQDESTLSEIVSDGQSCATSHDHAYSRQIDHLPSAPLNESASLICSFAECVDLTFNHQPSLLRHTRLKHSQSLHPIHCKPFSNVRRPTQSNHVLKIVVTSKMACSLCEKWFECLEIHVIQEHTVMEVVSGGFGGWTRTVESDVELERHRGVHQLNQQPVHQVTQLTKSSNQSSFDGTHNHLLPYNYQQTLQQPQHQQINLDQFNANPDQFNPNSKEADINFNSTLEHPNPTLNHPITLSKPITSKRNIRGKKFRTPKDIFMHYCSSECKMMRNRKELLAHIRTNHHINLDQPNSLQSIPLTLHSETVSSQQQQSKKIALHCNEDTSLHSPTPSQQFSSSQHSVQECKLDDVKLIESSMNRWSWNELEKCRELKMNGQIDGDKGNDEVGEECDDGESKMENLDEDDQNVGNDEKFVKDGQVSHDENSEDGVDQLNLLERGSNIEGAERDHRPSNMITSLTTQQARASFELLNDRNIEHTNKTVLTNSIESVPSPSHRHNTIPVFASKSYPNENQVTQLSKSSNQSSLYCPHNQLLQYNQQQTLPQSQHQQINLDKCNANLDHFNPNSADSSASNQVNSNPFPNQPVPNYQHTDLNLISTTSPTQSNLQTMDDDVNEGGEVITNEENEEKNEKYNRDDQTFANDEDLSIVNGQNGDEENGEVGEVDEEYDGDGQNGDGHLNGSNIDGTEAKKRQFSKIVPNGQVVVTDKRQTGKYVCKYCDKVFPHKSHLSIHLRTHTGGKPYKCPFENCNKTYSYKSKMKFHHMSHTGQYPHVCARCTKRFRTQYELTIHTRTHTGEKPYKCPFDKCNKTFALKRSMEMHHKSHTGQFPHACALCSRRFSSPFQLTIHNRSHTGERPFKCPFENCNSTFSKKDNMKLHHMSHTRQYPHVCSLCYKRFRKPHELRIHTQIHNGERPFKCNWKDCGMDFISKYRLEKHYRTHGSTVEL